MMLNTTRTLVEPSRATKLRWLLTRKAFTIIAGTAYPGLFQTASPGRDLFCALLAVTLEIYTLTNLWLVASIRIVAALGLAAVDIVAAIGFHTGQGLKTETACLIAVTDAADEQAALRLRAPFWHGLVKTFSCLVIIGLALFKIDTFMTLKSPATPGGITLLVVVCYGLVAFLHLGFTGFALAHLYMSMSYWLDKRLTLKAADRRAAKCHVRAQRVQTFLSPVPLIPCTANGNELTAPQHNPDGFLHTLRTLGVPEDTHVESMVYQQETPEQKGILVKECLRVQLEILHSEPLGEIGGTIHRNGAASAKPLASKVAQAARLGIVTLLVAASTLSLGSCAQKAETKKEFILEIASGSPLGNAADEALPPDLLDLMATAPFTDRWVAHPRILRLDTPQVAARDFATDLMATRGWMENFWAAEPDAARTVALLHTRWSEEKLGDLALPAPGGVSDMRPRMIEFVHNSAREGALVLAYLPKGRDASGQTSESRIKFDNDTVPVVTSVPQAHAAIEAALEKGEKRIVLLYNAPSMEVASVPVGPNALIVPTPTAPLSSPAGRTATAERANPSPAQIMTPRAGDNIIIRMDSDKSGESSAKIATVTLPQGAELIGEPILFEFNKDVLDAKALATVKRAATIIKARELSRIILIASADYIGPTAASDRYASRRGMVVEARLMMEGVPIERRIEVGARLSVKGSSPEERAHAREVRIYTLTEKSAKIATTVQNNP